MCSQKTFNILILIGVICWFVTFVFWKHKAVIFVNEDGPVEWAQVILLIISAAYCFLISRGHQLYYDTTPVKFCFLIFLVLIVLVIGEEISWGQRIFGIQTPDFIKDVNKQNEINLHNLNPVQRFRHWLLIGIGIFGLAAILLKDVKGVFFDQWLLPILKPSANLTQLFILVSVAGLFVEVGDILEFFRDDSTSKNVRQMAGRTSEIAELFVAMIAYSYSSSKYYDMICGNWKLREFLSRRMSVSPPK